MLDALMRHNILPALQRFTEQPALVCLRNALAISGGELSILYESTLSMSLCVMAAAIIIVPWVLARRKKGASGL